MPSLSIGRRSKRTDWSKFPGVNYAGGDREIVYQAIGQFISSFGIDGAACVQRAICEMHEERLIKQGFFGEALLLLLSPSLAALAEYRLGPYLQAETQGKTKKNCQKYYDSCKYSIFSPKDNYPSNDYNSTANSHLVDSMDIDGNLLYENESNIPLHREKRFFMIGPHRNIVFPPTTAFVATPTLNLPFMRELPEGFSSEISYSVPFTFSFDDLGLTSVINQFGYIPFPKKKKRDVKGITYPGGDRDTIYAVIADVMNNIGLNGHICLLRTICEIHEMPLVHHGLFGEYFHLLLTPSLAPDAEKRMAGFLKAEQLGKNCGDCSVFDKLCPKSFFNNPGAGQRFSTEAERSECRERHKINFRKENANYIRKVKEKFKKRNFDINPQTKFAEDVANQINFQNRLKQLKEV